MDFGELKNSWNEFGANEAAWSVDTKHCSAVGDNDMQAFYKSGVDDIERLKKEFRFLNVDMDKYDGEGLDFGCGLGRLTQGMCSSLSLKNVTGIDVSKKMIEGAKKNNKFSNCNYLLNEKPDLSVFSDNTFDVIVSMLVLQHMHPRYMHSYIKEFCRILKPGGVLMFNVPDVNLEKAFGYIEQISSKQNIVSRNKCNRLELTIKNCGRMSWNKEDDINLANQYLDSALHVIKHDDIRVSLSKPLKPEEQWETSFELNDIPEDASYVSFDMVYEGKFWFHEKGNPVLLLPIEPNKVTPIKTELIFNTDGLLAKTYRYRENGIITIMEVYGYPRDTVEEICNASGCEFIFASESNEIIPPFSGYRYYICKNK